MDGGGVGCFTLGVTIAIGTAVGVDRAMAIGATMAMDGHRD